MLVSCPARAAMSSFVAIVLLMSAMSSATAAKLRSIVPSRVAKPRLTVERMLARVAVGADALFFAGFFDVICGEYSTPIGRRGDGRVLGTWALSPLTGAIPIAGVTEHLSVNRLPTA